MRGRPRLVATLALAAFFPAAASAALLPRTPHLLPLTTAKLTLLYAFAGTPDGQNPVSTLLSDGKGNLFGTTEYGGPHGMGSVFEMTDKGKNYTQIYGFDGPHGNNPVGGLVMDDTGALIGTTEYGGTTGNGVIFKLTPSSSGYSLGVIYNFHGGDGQNPTSTLVPARKGVWYGTTLVGGTAGSGTIFKLTQHGKKYKEELVHSFQGFADQNPYGQVVLHQGVMYGTTLGAQGTEGGVFQLVLSTGAESEIFAFNGTDGAEPYSGLVMDATGALYGTTYSGGAANFGTVFQLVAGASSWTENVLYSFLGGNDGNNPVAGLLDDNGTFYGVTEYGGGSNVGTAFAVSSQSSKYTESWVYRFQGGNGPANPVGGLIIVDGVLYGTSEYAGGSTNNGSAFSIKI